MDHAKLTIEAYSKSAQSYAEKFMNYSPYQQQVDAFIEMLPSSVCVLDLGCGPGNTAKQLVSSGKVLSLVGADLCPEMIVAARRNVPDGAFFVEDLRNISYPSCSFDVVMMSFCIVHLTDQEAESLIRRMADWLNPGGMLYLSFMTGKQPGWEATSFSEQALFFNYYDEKMMVELLQQSGFSIQRVQRQGYSETDGSITTDIFIFLTKVI